MSQHIVVTEYNPEWATMFEREAVLIKNILKGNCAAVYHIGSTAVVGLKAKPIIDIMPIVYDLQAVDNIASEFIKDGYEYLGEFGIAGRRYLRKGGDERTHQIHIFDISNKKDIERHLAVRDFLRANNEIAKEYGILKQKLAALYPYDIDGYCSTLKIQAALIQRSKRMQSKQNNKDYIVGMYVRLSRDDERAGESLSIENQKAILSEYIEEQGWTLHDIYVDDGISGTTFERPGVKRLLDDAQQGVINTILVKDMSRFGRNYIMVGQYLDYVFPTFGIRFVALSDNIDTENKDTPAMDMMPITNVFNEWWAATTSKKLRAVRIKNAKEGKNGMSHSPYGYILGTDEKRTLQVNEETAPIVRRIFEMRASGLTPRKIADILNAEKVLTPNDYRIATTGINGVRNSSHLWHTTVLRTLLSNQAYIGNLVQHKSTTISYKNHKWQRRPQEDWIIVENAHEAIISKELWDKVKEVEKAVGHGKHTARGFMHPLSGLMFCADCGAKMRLGWNTTYIKRLGRENTYFNFNCGTKSRMGSSACFSHFITVPVLEQLVKNDVAAKAEMIIGHEAEFKQRYLERQATLADRNQADVKKDLRRAEKRACELDKLIEAAFEEKVSGKIPESVCVKLIEKYTAEQMELKEKITSLTQGLEEVAQAKTDVDEFIGRLKMYFNSPTLTREMCLALFDRLVIGGKETVTGKPQEIHIYYKIDIDSVLHP